MANLQGFAIAAAALLTGIYALTGFTRQVADDGEPRIQYKEGRWRRNIAVGAILGALALSVAIVPKGYVGVVYDLNGGIQEQELPEGLNFVVPIKQHVTNVDVRVKAWTFNDPNVYVHTEDFHEIRVPFTINYRIHPTQAAFVLQNVSGDPAETILSHAALNSVRTEVGSIVLDKLAQEVSTVAVAVENTITPQAQRNGLEIQYVAIEDTVVDSAYTQAVRDERISEREIRTAENNATAATFKATEQVNLAEGEAQSIARIAQAREDEQTRLGLSPIEYVWYTRWDGILPSTLLGGGGEFIVNLPN